MNNLKIIKNFNKNIQPKSTVLGHRTHLLDSWTASPEILTMPEIVTDGGYLEINLYPNETNNLNYKITSKNPLRYLKKRIAVDLPNNYIYDARYECDDNVSHYLADTVIKILVSYQLLEDNGLDKSKLIVLLRNNPSKIAKDLFLTLGIPVLETDQNVIGKIFQSKVHAGLTRIDENISFPDISVFSILKKVYQENLKYKPSLSKSLGDKIFISRKNTRLIENESEVEEMLSKHGYKKVYFEDGQYSLDEQWSIVTNASRIFAIHGAGIAPIVFKAFQLTNAANTKNKLVELFGPGYFAGMFRRLAAELDIDWYGIRGKLTPEVVRDLQAGGRSHVNSPFSIDLYSLEKMLKLMEGK